MHPFGASMHRFVPLVMASCICYPRLSLHYVFFSFLFFRRPAQYRRDLASVQRLLQAAKSKHQCRSQGEYNTDTLVRPPLAAVAAKTVRPALLLWRFEQRMKAFRSKTNIPWLSGCMSRKPFQARKQRAVSSLLLCWAAMTHPSRVFRFC